MIMAIVCLLKAIPAKEKKKRCTYMCKIKSVMYRLSMIMLDYHTCAISCWKEEKKNHPVVMLGTALTHWMIFPCVTRDHCVAHRVAFNNFFLPCCFVCRLSEYPLRKCSILVSNVCRLEWKRVDTFLFTNFFLKSLL